MSYEKINWQNGVTAISAENLNHMEDAIFSVMHLSGLKIAKGFNSVTPDNSITDPATDKGQYKYYGTVTVDISSAGFSDVPQVSATVATTKPWSAQASISSISATYITFMLCSIQSTTPIGIRWIAVGG